ncbi:MAG: hypothetical protein A4E57_02662 [Syntrophorhabdaceae bacterium PtaU1.Bin034]|nr:MAG: hypothetical protein A4E57_02662 [Syntrophorhabdaceae bacterium PtaU1.Bin034]
MMQMAGPFLMEGHFFFDSASIRERHVVFASAVRLFEDFPHKLLAFLRAQDMSPAELMEDLEHIRFWHDVMTNHKGRARSPSRTAIQKHSRHQAREGLQLRTQKRLMDRRVRVLN